MFKFKLNKSTTQWNNKYPKTVHMHFRNFLETIYIIIGKLIKLIFNLSNLYQFECSIHQIKAKVILYMIQKRIFELVQIQRKLGGGGL